MPLAGSKCGGFTLLMLYRPSQGYTATMTDCCGNFETYPGQGISEKEDSCAE